MDCERIEGLIDLGFFIKMKIVLINPPNYLLNLTNVNDSALAVYLAKSKLHPRWGNDAGVKRGETEGS